MKQSTFIPTHLSCAELVARIAKHHFDWQVCFLNDDHRPVIGIIPKTSWQVFGAGDTLIIHRQVRGGNVVCYHGDYATWQDELIAYADDFKMTHADAQGYQHGLMGFVGYDVSAHALNHNIAIKDDQPCAMMGHYDSYLMPCDGGFVLHLWHDDTPLHQTILNQLHTLITPQTLQPTPCQLEPVWGFADYQQAFETTQEYIKAGDVYQINLTQQWQGKLDCRLSDYLPSLIHKMNAPFAGYIGTGFGQNTKNDDSQQPTSTQRFELLSVSPELFFTFDHSHGQTHITTKPIKGTRPRHSDAQMDDKLKQELAHSQKDISENLMIVDLLRNDLGKYAVVGGVKTPKRFEIESFKNVHHMVSTITATLTDSTHPIHVLFGSLPAGSITGAPKKRACEIIHELENEPRGAYCGTMGYLNFDGTGQFNVLIRTLQAVNDTATLWAGGGITIKSNLDDEYQECFDKVGVIVQALSQP